MREIVPERVHQVGPGSGRVNGLLRRSRRLRRRQRRRAEPDDQAEQVEHIDAADGRLAPGSESANEGAGDVAVAGEADTGCRKYESPARGRRSSEGAHRRSAVHPARRVLW